MERKLALLVGNGMYCQTKRYSPLEKSVADVQTLAEPLRASNIGAFDEVQMLIDQPMHLIMQAIERFFQEKKPNDLLLLYLTGHGDLDRRMKWYFVCNETEPTLLSSTAISASFIRDVMDTSHSDRQIVILDTCYAGAFFTGTKSGADITNSAPTQLAGSGRSILAATGSTQLAWEGDKQTPTSIFTRYLVQGLTTGAADTTNRGTITVDGWFDYTSDQVRNETANQTPRKQVENQQGSIIIAKNPFWIERKKENVATAIEESVLFTQKTKEQWTDEGIRLYEAGRYAEALAKYQQALILDPEYALGYLNRGKAFSALKDYQVAFKNYTYALTFDPTSSETYYNRGLLYATIKEYQQALDDFTQALKLDPTSSEAKKQLEEVKKREKVDRKFYLKYSLIGHSKVVRGVAISPDGQTIISISDDKTMRVWDLHSGKMLRMFTGYRDLISIDYDKAMQSCDLQTRKDLYNFYRGGGLRHIAISSDGQTIVSSGAGQVTVKNLQTGKLLHILEREVDDTYYGSEATYYPPSDITCVAISPNGQTIVGGDVDNKVHVWDLQAEKKLLYTLLGHQGSITCIAISPDGQTIVSGGTASGRYGAFDHTLWMWDLQTGKEFRSFYLDSVTSIAISSDGRTIVVGEDWNGGVKLINFQTGKELWTLQGHKDERGFWHQGTMAVISQDGQTIVSYGGQDKTVKVWSLLAQDIEDVAQ